MLDIVEKLSEEKIVGPGALYKGNNVDFVHTAYKNKEFSPAKLRRWITDDKKNPGKFKEEDTKNPGFHHIFLEMNFLCNLQLFENQIAIVLRNFIFRRQTSVACEQACASFS
tara:strand:- start:244 stop:579 length:336 start_codon:yes stop_codon:yes gene_type:complete